MTKVFVYGTLKNGYGNHYLLRDSAFLGKGTTIEDHFTMFDGGFPYVINEGRFHVRGEVYEVNNERVMESLDRLEGVPTHYQRKDSSVKTDDMNIHDVTMYVAAPTTKAYITESERFAARQIIPDENNIVEWRR